MGGPHPPACALRPHELRVPTQPAVAPELERHYFL